MRVTTWTEYSLLIALHLAREAMHGRRPVAAREIAGAEHLPPDYVEQILLRLRRAGLIESTRGAKGGYRLAAAPSAVTVLDVMNAAEHQSFELNCDRHPVDRDRCRPSSACLIRPVWLALQQRVDDLLGGVTLADLLSDGPIPGGIEDVVSPAASPA